MMSLPLIIALIVIVALIVYINSRPSVFTVTRSIHINAVPAAIYPWLNDTKMLEKWSPWLDIDPDAAVTYAGPASGVGASSSWAGKKIGQGTATIIEVVPDDKVVTRLDFVKPFKGTNIATMAVKPDEDGARVTWSMTGNLNFGMKAFGLVMNCDKMCGPQFERGLAKLKRIVETL